MCLAIPGKVISISGPEGAPLQRIAQVSFGGVIKEISLGFVPEAIIGDYIIAHVGVAISRVDEAEAKRSLEYLQEIDALGENPPLEIGGGHKALD